MKYIELVKDGNIFVFTLIDSDNKNTFNSEVLLEYCEALDEIESSTSNAALVITSRDPKFFSNGIDLQWYAKASLEERDKFLYDVKKTLLRISLLNLPTIACITGHAYAMGAILASSVDFRIMRSDRGRICFPEVNHGMPLDEALLALINNLPNQYAVNKLVLTGSAFTGEECLANQIVDSIYPENELFDKSMDFAREMAGKNRGNYSLIKSNLKKSLMDIYKAW
jgi:enoyl-CoA hydratase/carnithine racemase